MCDPATLTMVAVSAAGSIAGHQAQRQQVKHQQKLFQRTQEIEAENYRQSISQLQERQRQEEAAASQEATQSAIQAAEARASARTAAGERGGQGLSLDALVADFDAQEAAFRSATERNRGFSAAQSRMDAESLRAQSRSRINAAVPTTPMPSYLTTGLQIGSTAAQGWVSHERSKD